MNSNKIIIFIVILLTLAGFVGGVLLLSRSSSKPQDPSIISTNGIHWHAKLQIFVKGQRVDLEEDIGRKGGLEEPIHTHTEDYQDGVIHMEYSGVVRQEDTRLGKFFVLWGKTFNENQIFDNTNGPDGTLKMLVNGQENTEFQNYLMKDGDVIEISYE